MADDESMVSPSVVKRTVKQSTEKKLKKNRRSFKKKNMTNKLKFKKSVVCFSVVGTNANGLYSKQHSLKHLVEIIAPSAVLVQEPKLKRIG